MHQAAEDQKKQFSMQVDQQVKMQEMDLDQQFLQVLQYVKQQATRQRAQLEQQAMQLSFEYQEKKVEEDMMAHQFELSKQQQTLKTQMVSNGPLAPLPSYKPAMSSSQQLSTQQVPSNPFASAQVAAIAADAMAPALAYAPLGGSCQTVGFVSPSFMPAQAVTAGAYSSMMASASQQDLMGSVRNLQMVPGTLPMTSFAAPSVPMYQSRPPSYQPIAAAANGASGNGGGTPMGSYQPALSPQPSSALLPAPLPAAPSIAYATPAQPAQ